MDWACSCWGPPPHRRSEGSRRRFTAPCSTNARCRPIERVISGALFTVAKSSTATTLAVIGFVSAGLVTFSQAVGVIIGATLGTTSTPWLVAIFGFRVRISAFALPMLGIGAFLWLIAKGKTRSAGAILAGFGLLFIGIEYLQTGMEGISWNLDAVGGSGPGWQWILAEIGILMSVVMQSSSAAAATTLVALHAGSLTFEQGCAMIVGQSAGTAATSALVAIGAGLAVRRAALAHIVYNVTVGIIGILLLGPIAAASNWVGTQFDDPNGVLALAAFSSIFKFAGVLAFYPWLERFSRLIERIPAPAPRRPSAASIRSSPKPEGRRARGRLAGDAGDCTWFGRCGPPPAHRQIGPLRPAGRRVRQIDHFLESLSLETPI